ncbi:helicase HerA-like domain-containing protein [Sphingomicrobium marinum]|uniref:helicase HerA-like domain-containing protein n=1 Tax=Sphingomicrobium marinum TaxID=1227950 RepID=UPI00223FDFD1|nr:helicase HerA-like domain-containing protein [Sphingomicrobium marinum]
MDEGIFLGTADGEAQYMRLDQANRHGLIAGATGTGKTISLQGIAEGFSEAGVPCFVSDVKSDLAGLAMAGSPTHKLHKPFTERAQEIGYDDYSYTAFPVQFWDLFGKQGHPVRTTVTEMGPLLLSRLMELTDTQEGVLTIAFHVADAEGLLLLDLDDLQSMLGHIGERRKELSLEYGNVTTASVGAIQRKLLQLRSQGGDMFFGEPALKLEDFIATDEEGKGVINILAADKLMASPRLYATFLLWLLSELFETLPEVGDPDKPKLVFFFDEAHLLFDDAPKALMDKVEQVVRLIRSKGVGVFFITQNPIDIPDDVAGQLGNRVQHALRAFTPRDQKAVKAAAETFRTNPDVDVETVITQLRIGEALVSTLDRKGAPIPVERVLMKPPRARAGPLTKAERAAVIASDAVGSRYDELVDRVSAEELLADRAAKAAEAAAEKERREAAEKEAAKKARTSTRRRSSGRRRQSSAEKMASSAARSIGSSFGRQIGNAIIRGILGSLKR